MLRDDYIVEIRENLDRMRSDPDSRIKYNLIMDTANKTMNMTIEFNEKDDTHKVYWFNRKFSTCFDESLEKLVEIIHYLNSGQ